MMDYRASIVWVVRRGTWYDKQDFAQCQMSRGVPGGGASRQFCLAISAFTAWGLVAYDVILLPSFEERLN